jgi:hypothetical protein
LKRIKIFSKKGSAIFARLQIHSILTKTENLSLAVNQTFATIKTPENFINLLILQFLVINNNYYPES